jgi:hypothetical protein
LSPVNLVFLGLCAVTLMAIAIGFVKPPTAAAAAPSLRGTVVAWVRLGLALASSVALVFGPGFALACLRRRPAGQLLGFLALLGPALLAAIALISWFLAQRVSPQRTSAVMLAAIVLAVGAVVATHDSHPALDRHDVRAGTIVAILLAVVAAKGVYSLGPVGELYHGLISRTLEVGDRGDSRIPYHVVQLVANGISPFTTLGQQNFLPWSFSDRGPLAGLAASPIVLVSGATVPVDPPNQPWSLFDPQGFAAYRLAMMTMAVTAVLAAYGIMRRLAGPAVALFTTILIATTPFVIHESFFTWPKLLTAGMVLLAGDLVLRRKPASSGLMIGIAYLVHPGALISVPTIGLLALLRNWRSAGSLARSWRLAWPLAQIAVGVIAFLVLWRVINGSHYTQATFLQFVRLTAGWTPVTLQTWLAERFATVVNTLVPGVMFLFFSRDIEVNAYQAMSPPIIHFFFQYWNTLPFAVGIIFYPALVVRICGNFRRHAWTMVALIVAPFILFAIYMGFSDTGLIREGLQAWLLSLLMLYGYLRFTRGPWAWEVSWPGGALMACRAAESLVMLLVPSIVTNHALIGRVSDILPLAIMVVGMTLLGREAWRLSSVVSLVSPSVAWGEASGSIDPVDQRPPTRDHADLDLPADAARAAEPSARC